MSYLLSKDLNAKLLSSGTKHSGDTHGGTSTTSNISSKSRCT